MGEPPDVVSPKPVTMFKAKHVFVELHEFRDDHWHETHRWNHGLEEDLVPKASFAHHNTWTGPHLPSISLHGMMSLRQALTPNMVILDVDDPDQTFEPIVDAMLNALVEGGKLPPDRRDFALSALMAHLKRRRSAVVARYGHKNVAKIQVSKEKETWDSFKPLVSPSSSATEQLATGSPPNSEPHSPLTPINSNEPKSPNTPVTPVKVPSNEFGPRTVSQDSLLKEDDPLRPDAEEEAVHILVDVVDWLVQEVVVFIRLSMAISTGLEEMGDERQPSAKFIVMIFGPPNVDGIRRYIDMGEAAAALLQDDSIVTTAYNATNPEDITNAMENRFWKLRLLPHTKRPTQAGIRKRASKMLQQMKNVQGEDKKLLPRTQTQKWAKRAVNPFERGISVSGVMSIMQKYALPLLTGITFALVAANLDEKTYDHWAGYGSSPFQGDEDLSHRRLGGGGNRPTVLGIAVHGHGVTLHFIVNDIFMCLFFGLAGKEICEALQPGGSLYPPTRTTVNVLAGTIGGVAGPVFVYLGAVALLYAIGLLDNTLAFGDYAIGWGIPTATDISLAWVTALCVFGNGHPAINYLLLLAVVDDGIGLLIIAFAYPDPSNPFQPKWLLLVLFAMCVAYALRRLRCAHWQPYIFIAGPFSWFGLLYAALHPALALVFVVPFMPLHIESDVIDLAGILSQTIDDKKDHDGHHGCSPLHDFEEATKTFVDFIVLFCFGAVNAGVQIDSIGMLTGVVLFSLVVGKTLGIVVASAIATACKCPPPKGMRCSTVAMVGFIASAGLTVAIFVSGEAFGTNPQLAAESKMGALLSIGVAASAICGSSLMKKMGFSTSADPFSDTSPEGSIADDEAPEDDEALEDVIVGSTVANLNKIHQAEHAIEHHTHITRKETVKRLSMHSQSSLGLAGSVSPTGMTMSSSMHSQRIGASRSRQDNFETKSNASSDMGSPRSGRNGKGFDKKRKGGLTGDEHPAHSQAFDYELDSEFFEV